MNNNVITVIIVLLVVGVVGYWAMNRQPSTTTVNIAAPSSTSKTTPTGQTDQVTTNPDMPNTDAQSMPDNTSATIILSPVDGNTEEQTGTAVLTETPDGVVVTIDVTGYSTDAEQPAHFHVGSCPGIGAIKHPLENLKGGNSTTVLQGVTFEQLKSELPLAINIHKSADDMKVYTACGNVTLE